MASLAMTIIFDTNFDFYKFIAVSQDLHAGFNFQKGADICSTGPDCQSQIEIYQQFFQRYLFQIQRLKCILQCSSELVASVYIHKLIYIQTLKMYLFLK